MSKNKHYAVYITALAMLTAVSVVIGIVCKNLFTVGVYYRFTLENLGVIFAGIFFGPGAGVIVALAADTISCVLSTNPAINPIISLGAAAVGFVSGAVMKYIYHGKVSTASVAVSSGTAHLFGQVIIKSIGKMIYYGMPWYGIFIGFASSIAACTIEVIIIRILSKNPQIHKFIVRNTK